jgi:hypothetical protein
MFILSDHFSDSVGFFAAALDLLLHSLHDMIKTTRELLLFATEATSD